MLSATQEQICSQAGEIGAGLSAVLVNASLTHPSQSSHTDTLLDVVAEIFRTQGTAVDRVRLSQYRLAPCVYPDMTEHGWEADDWPKMSDYPGRGHMRARHAHLAR
ncbi:hypothetical protein WNZ15_23545 [Roseibium sp. AS2]|uniref:hypothetical protein n=1 Tax=Roseibium sp. AS2 TaxID=3135781 RepID=UPI00317F6ECC